MNNQVMIPASEQMPMVQTQNGGNQMLGVFASPETFDMASRMAKALASASIVPKDYQNNAGNCMIAIDTAARMQISPMMVMQNLYVVNGRPAWSSQWIIAAINASKKYACDLQFEYGNKAEDGGLSCKAWAMDRNGNRVEGPTITMNMAKSEGWATKNGSKWQTMPEVMISYRAASFFGRRNCPEITLGIYAEEEAASIPVDTGTAQTYPTAAAQKEPEPMQAISEPSPDERITKEQAKALIDLAGQVFGGDATVYGKQLISVINAYGYQRTVDIKVRDYKLIFDNIRAYADTPDEFPADVIPDEPAESEV